MPGDWFTVQVTKYKVGWQTRYNFRVEKLRDGSNEVDEAAGDFECYNAHNPGAVLQQLGEWIMKQVNKDGETSNQG